MKNEIFPQIIEKSENQEIATYEKKCLFHERFLYHYLVRKIEGWSVKDFLKTEKIDRYALYAVTDFTTLFIKDLKENDDNEQKIICDKNADKFCDGILGCKVLFPNEVLYLYKSGKIKKIIIMSILHENEIIDELMKKGVLLEDLISVVSVLYS